MFSKKIFSERMKRLRLARGVPQTDLANLLQITRTQISDLENGKTTTSLERLDVLANYFAVPVDYLLNRGIFKNWEELMTHKETLITFLYQEFPYTKDWNLNDADERDLMKVFPAMFEKVEIDGNHIIAFPLFPFGKPTENSDCE